MRWRSLLVAAVALLAISAMPASAQNASAVASSHTTFGTGSQGEPSPTQTTNMSIEGSGASASLVTSSTSVYNPLIDEGDAADVDRQFVGDESSDVVTSSEIRIEPATSGSLTTLEVDVTDAVGSSTGPITVRIVEETPDGNYGEGTEVATWDPAWTTGTKQIDISAYDVVAGQTYTVEFVSSPSDNDGTADQLYLDIDDSASSTWFSFSGSTRQFYADLDVTISEQYGSAKYIGAPHDGENIQQGWTNLTLINASADVTWQADGDGDGQWTNVTSSTYTSTGNYTTDLSGTTTDRWRVRVDIEATGSNPTAEIHDEGLLFEARSPTFSDPEPPDQMQIQNATGDVSINVSDREFGLAQGDSVTVSATDDEGTSLGTTTLSSNGTASFQYSSEAGENVIEWTATDTYGNTETFTQNFETPENLYIRPESRPSDLVDGANVSVEVRFYAQDRIYTRTTSDGIVNLAGLPADARFAVVISADGYYRRRVIIDSLFAQQTVYLLNESKPAVEKELVLKDVSGNYPAQSTRLYIQRSINNSTDYRTVAADYFGATSSFATYLQTDQRYRLIVENDQGDRRTLGSYTPVAAGVEPLRIEGVGLYEDSQEGYIANASTQVVDNGTQRQVVVRYRDPAAATDSYQVRVVERRNESNVVYAETVTGPVRNYSAYVDVANDSNYVVNWSATRNGQQIGGLRPVGTGDLGIRIPLDAEWLGTLGLLTLVFVAALAGERYATHIALSVVAFAGMLMYLAVIDLFLPGWWGALVIAAGGHLAQRRPAA